MLHSLRTVLEKKLKLVFVTISHIFYLKFETCVAVFYRIAVSLLQPYMEEIRDELGQNIKLSNKYMI